MSIDPIRRRFGSGAARLAISSSAERSLARAAQEPTRFEHLAGSAPTLFAVLLAALLWVAAGFPARPPAPDAEPTRIQQWAKRPPLNVPQKPTATRPAPPAPAPAAAQIASEPPASAESLARSPLASDRPTPKEHALPMPMLGRIDFQAPAETATGPGPDGVARRDRNRPDRPRSRGGQGGQAALERRLQMAANDPGPAASDAVSSGRPGPSLARRPSARPAPVQTGAPEATQAWTPTQSRAGFMAQAEPPAPDAAPAALRGRRPPQVAAARPAALSAGAPAGSSAFGAGWEEVPLDALPDCSPPGRQDQLKQSILRRAAQGSQCAGQAADYRFVETRNLGAFLLWSRPSARAERRGRTDKAPRDACDVLEAALRCLDTMGVNLAGARRSGAAPPTAASTERGASAPRNLIPSLTPKEESFIR